MTRLKIFDGDFKFDLQRFAITAIIDGETVTVEGVLPASPQAGKYYFQANSSVGTTFGNITIRAAIDDNSATDYFMINSVTGITLPGTGNGTLSTGSSVGSSVEDAVAISGLGSSTLTFGGTAIAFTNANADAAVNIYGGNKIAKVGLENGSFKIAAKNGASLYVNGINSDNLVNIDKPFNYAAGDSPTITLTGNGANVSSSDGAEKIYAPSGKGQITIGGAALNYNTAGLATIGVVESSVKSFNLHDVGDKLTVTAALARSEDFVVTDGDLEISYALPTMTAYTVEKLESAYLATGMASVVYAEGEGIYKISNNSGNVALALNRDGELSGIVLNTNDSIVAANADDDLAAINGTELKLYSGSYAEENIINVNLEGLGSYKTVVSKTANGLNIANIAAEDEIALNGVTYSYENKGGNATLNDNGEVAVSIASSTSSINAGMIKITDGNGVTPQIVVNDSATLKVDNGGETYTVNNFKDTLTLTGIRDGASLQATSAMKISANATKFTVNDAAITIKSDEHYSGSALITLKDSGEVASIIDQQSGGALSYIVGDSYNSDYDIFNSKDSLPVNGSNNPETIYNNGNYVTINALGGNDTITNTGENVLINGGDGNNSIETNGFNVTVISGGGNDHIGTPTEGGESDNSVFLSGDGNDTLIIDRYAYPSSGSHISIDAGNGHDQIAADCSNSTISGGAGNDSIRSYGAQVSISGGAGKDTIQTYVFEEGDSENVTISGGAGNDIIQNWSGANVVVQYTNGDGNDIVEGFTEASTLQIVEGNYSTKKSGGDVIVTVGKGKITLRDAADFDSVNIAGVKKDPTHLEITDATKSPITVGAAIKTIDASKRTKAVQITGNKLANIITGGTSNDSLSGGKGNDTLNGGKGNDKLWGGKGSDVFIFSAGNDTIADYAKGDKISIGSAIAKTSLKGSDAIFTVGKNTLTVQKGKDKEITFINAAGKEQKIIGGALLINNSTKAKTTLASWRTTADASTRTKAIQITGNKLANLISGGTGNDSLSGGKGNDTLNGGKGNDKLWGGKGSDIFICNAGNDTIADYAKGDKISIGSAIAKTSFKGSDAVFTIGKNTLTVTKGKDKEITFINAAGKEQKIIGGSLLINNSTSAKTTLESWRTTADASTRTKATTITGNKLANTILGGAGNDKLYGQAGNDYLVGNAGNDSLSGGAGNDTLIGGKGNDMLWGGKGADTFIYDSGDGNDIIYGFDKNDMLQITDVFSATCNKAKTEVYFKVGSTAKAITLKNFSATSFNVNGTSYKISGTKLK